MSSEWVSKPLSEVIDIISGGTPKTSEPSYWGGSIPWLSVVDFNNGNRYVTKAEKHITEAGLLKSATTMLQEGDIIISARGTVGALAQIGKPMAFNQSCYGIRGKNGLANTNFIYYVLKHSVQKLKNVSHGAVFDTITKQTFNLIDVKLPSYQEQEKIAGILGCLDDRITLLRETNATLEAITKATFKSWFVDFEPVHAKKQGQAPLGIDEVTASLFPSNFDDSELGLLPSGWNVEPLTEVFDFKEGPGIRNWQYTNSDQGTRFINIRCIQDGDLSIDTANRITDKEANGKYAHFHLKAWDVVVSTSGTLGRSAIVREEHLPLMLNTSVIRFQPIKEKMRFSFLYEYLNSSEFLFKLESMASGSVQKNFGPMHLKQMKLICPPIDLLSHYEAICRPLFEKIVENRAKIATLSSIRDTLLPRLISGQLRLQETEELLEEIIQ